MTNVPALVFTPTGLVAPAEGAILSGVMADINAAFGGGVNPALNTPQGQLAMSEAAIIGAKNADLLLYVNGVDPAYSSGRMQDAIGRIYFIERNPAQPSTAQCLCTGSQSTTILEGSLASDGTNLWTCLETGTIGVSGNITLTFACTVDGPVPVPEHTVTSIYRTVPGWDSIDNPTAGVVGTVVESRADFEHRRQLSVAQNSVAPIQAIVGKVLNVPDVIDAFGTQNDTGSPLTIGGVTLVAHSLYVCVSGGDPDAVALAIWTKKIPGCAYNGDTTVVVQDTSNGYTPPYPAYNVTFQTAAALPILFAVNITDSPQAPADAEAQVRAAITAAFNGSDGGARARIGSTLYASRYYAGVAMLGPWAQIVDILIGSDSATHNSVVVPIDSAPTLDPADITVSLV